MKVIVSFLLATLFLMASTHLCEEVSSIQSLASQFQSSVEYPLYDVRTLDGLNMDCLKTIKTSDKRFIGVFHSSAQQKASGYSALYLSQMKASFDNPGWTKVTKLSERGSQGYIYQIANINSFLVLYELQSHENGNTVAVRYYESYQKLQINNFLYQYQILQRIDNSGVRNIGTPSVQDIVLEKGETNPHFNVFNLTLKFHYSPDGNKDLPGYGYVNLVPLRDFVDGSGKWIGGCKQKYGDWLGKTDSKVQQAISRIRPYSKIGQRDLFVLVQNSIPNKYYLYEVNMNPTFNWKDWRIVLYSQKDNRAVQVNFSFGRDEDIANPHISLLSYERQSNSYSFFLAFFLPSEGVQPGTEVRAGEMTAIVIISP